MGVEPENNPCREERLASLLRIARVVHAIDEPESLLQRTLEIVLRETGSTGGAILVGEPVEEAYRLVCARGLGREVPERVTLDRRDPVVRKILEDLEPICWAPGGEADSPLGEIAPGGRKASAMAFPLTSSGRSMGVLCLYRRLGPDGVCSAFAEPDRRAFAPVAESVAVAVRNSQILGELRQSREVLERHKRRLKRKNEILTHSNRLLAEENIRQQQELRMASEIQHAFLPHRDLDVPGLDLAAEFVPMHGMAGVAGDFYNHRLVEEGKMVELRIGDVCGHGVPAALLMILTETLFDNFQDVDLGLDVVLRRVNESLLAYFEEEVENQVTVFSGWYDLDRRHLRFVRAGHPAPLLFRRRTGEVVSLETGGTFLGVFHDIRFEEGQVVLEPGDLLLLYTDGIVEATDLEGRALGVERLIEGVRQNLHLTSWGQLRRIHDVIKRFTSDALPADDRTLLLFRLEEEGFRRLEGEIEDDRWADLLLEETVRKDDPEAWRRDLEVAIRGALCWSGWVGGRGDGRSLQVRYRVGPGKTVVHLRSEGPGIRGGGLASTVAGQVDAPWAGGVDEIHLSSRGTRLTLVKYRGGRRIERDG